MMALSITVLLLQSTWYSVLKEYNKPAEPSLLNNIHIVFQDLYKVSLKTAMKYPFLANFNIKSKSHQMKLLNRIYLFVWLLSVYFIFSPFVFLVGNIIEFSFEDDAKNYEHLGVRYTSPWYGHLFVINNG